MTKAVAPYYPSQWFELLRFWLLLEYQQSLEYQKDTIGQDTIYTYLQKAVLHEIQITVQEQWFPGQRLKDSWVEFLRSIPKASVTVISHIQRVSEAAQEKGLMLLGAKLVLSLFYQYNSMLATQVQKFAEDRLDEVLGLSTQHHTFRGEQMDDLDDSEKQFYVSLYFKLCEAKRELLVKILFYFQKLPNECFDVVRQQLVHFLIAPTEEKKQEQEKKEDAKKKKKTKSSTQALVTSRSREIQTLMSRIAVLQGEQLSRKKKIVLLLAERFAKQEDNISSAFSSAVLSMARKLEMPTLAAPVFHCIEFDKVAANNFFEKAMTSLIGLDGKPTNLQRGINFLQRLLTSRTSQEERCEIFKSIVDLQRIEIGKNVHNLMAIYDSIVRPQFLKVTYVARVLKSVLSRKYEPPPMLTLFIVNKVMENFSYPEDSIQNVLRKLLDRKVWDHPSLWSSFKLLIRDYPNAFLKLMKEVPHGIRQQFYDEYPRLKNAAERERRDPKMKSKYGYKK